MIIISQTVGTDLTNLAVNETTFATQSGRSFESFEYDGADWSLTTDSPAVVVDLADYGITFTGTPASGDTIIVAYEESEFNRFSAGKGINCVKINQNFSIMQNKTNTNENQLNTIASTALLKNGSNLTPEIIAEFKQEVPNIISGSGTISLTDNSSNFLTITGSGATISLPTIAPDNYSHTINLTVQGSNYSLNYGTTYTIYQPLTIDTTKTYNLLYIYNKIDSNWYVAITQ